MTTLLSYRPAISNDESFIHELTNSVREPQSGIHLGKSEEKNQFYQSLFASRQLFLKEHFPDAVEWIIQLARREIGFFLVKRTKEEIHIIEIVVAQEYRNRGIGSMLLHDLIKESYEKNIPIRTRIPQLNPAIRLFQRLGFRLIGDLGYYRLLEYSKR